MKKGNFLDLIDCNLKYDEVYLKYLLEEARKIDVEMVYALLEEVLRVPYNVKIGNIKEIQKWFVEKIKWELPYCLYNLILEYLQDKKVDCEKIRDVFLELYRKWYGKYRSLFNVLLEIGMDCGDLEDLYDRLIDE